MLDEHRAARAACVYLLAYAARCQHAYPGDARSPGLTEFVAGLRD